MQELTVMIVSILGTWRLVHGTLKPKERRQDRPRGSGPASHAEALADRGSVFVCFPRRIHLQIETKRRNEPSLPEPTRDMVSLK